MLYVSYGPIAGFTKDSARRLANLEICLEFVGHACARLLSRQAKTATEVVLFSIIVVFTPILPSGTTMSMLQVLDGPSCTLLDFMKGHNFQAPPDWKGYRELSEK